MTAEPATTLPARQPIENLYKSVIPRTTLNIPPPPKPSASAPATLKTDEQAVV